MSSNFIKGIECVNCQTQFTWQSLPKANRVGLTTCICPKCQTTLKQQVPIAEIAILVVVAILFISLLFWSIENNSQNETLVLCAIGLIISHFTKKLIFKGYIRTKKVDN